MKTLVFISILCLSFLKTYSQGLPARTEFMGTHYSGSNPFYYTHDIRGNQFYSSGWVTGRVTNTRNEVFANGYLFLYDKVRQLLFIKERDSSDIFLSDKNKIRSFTLNTGRVHNFVLLLNMNPQTKMIL